MQRKVIPDSEHKLVILYILDRFGPLTETQLYIFLIDMHLMQYIDLKINQVEMEERGEIHYLQHPTGQLMAITPTGKYALDTFVNHIPASKRALIDRETPAWRTLFRAQLNTVVTSVARQGERCWYRMRILEGQATLLDLTVLLDESPRSDRWNEEWSTTGTQIYGALTAALGDGFTGERSAADLPPTAVVRQVNDTEWMVHLMDDVDHPALTVTLMLPDAGVAHHYARRWEANKQQLFSAIQQAMVAHLRS